MSMHSVIGDVYGPRIPGLLERLSPETQNELFRWSIAGYGPKEFTVDLDRIYVGTFESDAFGLHYVYCIDDRFEFTQLVLWAFQTDDPIIGAPRINAGTVFVGTLGGKLFCLNASTGAQIWNHTVGGGIATKPKVVYDRVYFGADDGRVYCLDAFTGEQVWNYTTGDAVTSSPVVEAEQVYFGSYDANVYCVNASDGGELWRYATGNVVESTPALYDGRLFIGSYDSRVYCLNTSDGGHLWNFTTGGAVSGSPFVDETHGTVCVGSLDYNVYCLNASTGAEVWRYRTGYFVQTSPVGGDGLLYVGSNDQRLYCLNLSDGRYLWNNTDGSRVHTPALYDGRLYVSTDDHLVIAFGLVDYNYTLDVGGTDFPAYAVSNSRITDFAVNQSQKQLSFNVTGEPATAGVCVVAVPNELLGGPYQVTIDGTPVPYPSCECTVDTTIEDLLIAPGQSMLAAIVTIHYPQSSHRIEIIGTTIIPELPTPLPSLLPLAILAATFILAIGKMRSTRMSNQ
jgi:outer membrane protein assembly factor BamB